MPGYNPVIGSDDWQPAGIRWWRRRGAALVNGVLILHPLRVEAVRQGG